MDRMTTDLARNGPVERDIEQAVTALKKGAYLLKYGRRGKPKFCPFRLSNSCVQSISTYLGFAANTLAKAYIATCRSHGDLSPLQLKEKSASWCLEDPMKICCGYHEKDGHVWCGQKGRTDNGTEVFGGACPKPETTINWDNVHYSEAVNHWFADRTLNGSLSDPPVPITHACYRT